ncbi:hypothetical protein HanRHA438_Chr15g0722901 [Helianthus annuus]|nr:hypothetical protein HanRHA438_Chr15g0722901 [Helianthus annuus]
MGGLNPIIRVKVFGGCGGGGGGCGGDGGGGWGGYVHEQLRWNSENGLVVHRWKGEKGMGVREIVLIILVFSGTVDNLLMWWCTLFA